MYDSSPRHSIDPQILDTKLSKRGAAVGAVGVDLVLNLLQLALFTNVVANRAALRVSPHTKHQRGRKQGRPQGQPNRYPYYCLKPRPKAKPTPPSQT